MAILHERCHVTLIPSRLSGCRSRTYPQVDIRTNQARSCHSPRKPQRSACFGIISNNKGNKHRSGLAGKATAGRGKQGVHESGEWGRRGGRGRRGSEKENRHQAQKEALTRCVWYSCCNVVCHGQGPETPLCFMVDGVRYTTDVDRYVELHNDFEGCS